MVGVLLIGLACAGHQAFSANLYTLPGDLFPRWMAGSVVGLGGLAGAVGGMLMAKYAGMILERVGSYQPIFIVAACAYLVALLVIHLIVPRYAPRRPGEDRMTHLLKRHPDRLFPADPRTRDIARALYGPIKDLPIVSPHGHTDPALVRL